MTAQPLRPPAVAGSWYSSSPTTLRAEVEHYLHGAVATLDPSAVIGLVVPHAGLMYSGPVAAWAYRAIQGASYEAVVLVGPSHYVGFDGVAIATRGGFDMPFGPALIAEALADELVAATPVIREYPAAHVREHSLEMQLPFLRRILPTTPIVPMIMGHQASGTIGELADALARVLTGRRVLLVASSDLSHYLDAKAAAVADTVVLDAVGRFDADALMTAVRARPDHACGAGPIVAVMRAARALGATTGTVLRYADSGDVSGDKAAVVGYMAAAFTRG